MFKYETNIDQVKLQIKHKLEGLIDGDKILREAALDVVVLVSDRVQQRGENSEGQKMITKSHTKKGAYSYDYGKLREDGNKKFNGGLQTDHIDLTFTGDMFNNYTIAPEGQTSYIIGFKDKLSSDKADWNERKFGRIFQLSEKESELIKGIITKRINAILNK